VSIGDKHLVSVPSFNALSGHYLRMDRYSSYAVLHATDHPQPSLAARPVHPAANLLSF
jgi:hypothetical protein